MIRFFHHTNSPNGIKSRLSFRSFLKSFICLLLALLMASPVSALSEEILDFYNLNGIYYYDPSGNNSRCYNGTISLMGTKAIEKIWSGLTTFMTPEQAAGVMGNMWSESNYFNPVQHEVSQMNKYPNKDIINDETGSYGVGLIQWSGGRRVNMLRYIQSKDASLMSYFLEPNIYSDQYNINGDKFIELAGEDVFDRLVQYELEYLKEELNTTRSYKGIFDTTTVEEATNFFLRHVEIPADPDGSYPVRLQHAQEIYNTLNGTMLGNSTGGNMNVTGSSITIIGDSITEGSKSQIESLLPGVDINSEVGRQFTTGIEIAKSMELRRVVVFALGTNSANLTKSQIDEAIKTIGSDKNIYFVTNYGTADYSNNNTLLVEAASKYSNVTTIEWARSVDSSPEQYISSDGVHPTAAGKELFAKLIYNAVTSSNLSSDGCVVSGDLQSLVLRYAWPTYHAPNYFDMMPDYQAAVDRRRSEGKYVGGANRPGIDCGGFVTTLIQDSGFAPEYNGHVSNVPWQEMWVVENGWTLLNESETSTIDTSILQPGDVAFQGAPLTYTSDHKPKGPGHTFIYVGQISGFDSNIASASYGGSSDSPAWRTPMAGKESLTSRDGYPTRWYRKN